MSPNSKMGEELKFQQRWEFRRRDNDFESSSDDSKSNSSGEPVFKKLKLVSTLISPENDETSNTPRFQQKGKDDPGTGSNVKFGRAKKRKIGSSKKNKLVNNDTERDSFKKFNRKKSKGSSYDTASLKNIKIFMESLLEELKVTRENLFIWMREEMHKLMANDTTLQPTRRESSYGHEVVQGQHQSNFESGLKLMADDTTQQPTRRYDRFGQEIVQVQHQKIQNNLESGMKLMADDTAWLSTRREGSYRQEIVPVQHQNNFESGMELTADDTMQWPMRIEGSCRQERIPLQPQNNFESSTKLVADDTTQQPTRREGSFGQETVQLKHQNTFESGMKSQKCNGGSIERSVKSQRTADSNNHYQVLEDRVEHGQDIVPLTSTEKDKGERFGLSVKPDFLSNSSDQVASSMYLTLPTVLPDRRAKNHRIDSSSCSYIQPGISGNKTIGNVEIANLMLQTNTQRGYFLGMQQEGQLGSIAQVGTKTTGCFDHISVPTSGIGAGFPVPFHQVLDGGFSIPSQVGIENLPRKNNNILGLSMNGGTIRFSGGSHALSDRYVANNFHSHLNYKPDGRGMAFQAPDLKEGGLFPN